MKYSYFIHPLKYVIIPYTVANGGWHSPAMSLSIIAQLWVKVQHYIWYATSSKSMVHTLYVYNYFLC